MTKQFTITKRIAKQGKRSIVLLPKILNEHLKPGTIVELTINVVEENE